MLVSQITYQSYRKSQKHIKLKSIKHKLKENVKKKFLFQLFCCCCKTCKIANSNCVCISGPSPPRSVQAQALSTSAVQVTWQPPENPNGGIIKYVIEYQPVGQGSPHHWLDINDRNKTTKDVTALNSSTLYQFRVRGCSKVPGEWSTFVQEKTKGDGKKELLLYV